MLDGAHVKLQQLEKELALKNTQLIEAANATSQFKQEGNKIFQLLIKYYQECFD
jgi:hypothetical protein